MFPYLPGRFGRGKAIRDAGREHNLSQAHMALAWCYSRWFIDLTVIGATRMEHLRENIDALSLVLPEKVLDGIEKFTPPLPIRTCEKVDM